MILNRKVRVLSLDGGGIRGILSSQILLNIENLLKEKYGNDFKIGDYFDIITGTSTGGIITSLILLQNENGELIYSAKDVIDLYLNNKKNIFKKSFLHRLKTVFGFFGSKFQEDSFEKLLYQYFGNSELKNLKKPCVICSYDTLKRNCVLFKQHYAKDDLTCNFYLRDVVRATSAAPTYFRPVKIKSFNNDEYSLIDGGLYANNPTMCALIEVNKVYRKDNFENFDIKDIKILSIGTGGYDGKYKHNTVKKWGIIQWILPFIDMSMSATNEVTDYQVRKIYEYGGVSENYLRLDSILTKKDSYIDNVSNKNINNLINKGNDIFMINKEKIEKFIEL